jgi:hypothetical protein
MRKHRIDKIQEISGASVELCPADTPEETAALIAELLLIAERMPVEKMIPKNLTLYNLGDAEILDKKNLTKFDTKTDAKTDTKINSGDDTETFSNEQLLILEQIQQNA